MSYAQAMKHWRSHSRGAMKNYRNSGKMFGQAFNPTGISRPSVKASKPKDEPKEQKPKEPWQMTEKEYVKRPEAMREFLQRQKRHSTGAMLSSIILDPDLEGLVARTDARWHEYLVQKALKEGKPVPPEVLADYPDLVTKPEDEAKDKKTKTKQLALVL